MSGNGHSNGNARAPTYASPTLEQLVSMCLEVFREAGDAARTYTNSKGEDITFAQPNHMAQLKAVELAAKLLGYLGIEGGKMDMDQLRRVLKLNGYELVAKGTS